MKYRIKIIHYKNGRIEYFAQKAVRWRWVGLAGDGEAGFDIPFESRWIALDAIDLNYEGNFRKETINFEYINK